MTYQPWVGKLDDGTEVLVFVYATEAGVEAVEVAFRPVGARVWGPPVLTKAAP